MRIFCLISSPSIGRNQFCNTLKAYTYLNKREDAGAASFSEFAKLNQADGLTIFVTPEVVAPDQEAIDRIQADTVNWQNELAIVVQKKNFVQAAEIQAKISENDNLLAHVRDSGMTWLKEAMGDAWSFTQVFVLGGEYFPDAKSYPPTVGEFMQHVAQLSATLTSTGLCGAPAHRTPLQARVFVPIGSVTPIIFSFGVTGAPGASIPAVVVDYAKHGGASNAIGVSLEAPMVARSVPQEDSYTTAPQAPRSEVPPIDSLPEVVYREFTEASSKDLERVLLAIIPDKVKDLNSDERRVAEKLLEGLAVKRAADACGMSWQSISKTLKPSIVAKFAEAGLDFDALYEKAKTERSEKSEE